MRPQSTKKVNISGSSPRTSPEVPNGAKIGLKWDYNGAGMGANWSPETANGDQKRVIKKILKVVRNSLGIRRNYLNTSGH